MNQPWKMDEKDNEILHLIATSFVTAKEIADRLFMSESTVRRRLTGLEKAGWIIRTHGGAVLNKNQQLHKNLPLYFRAMQLDEEKHLLASKAALLVSDGDTIFIDSSSTALFLLPLLNRFQNITVFTNSLKAATVLAELEIPCTFFGGDVVPGELACNSAETFDMIGKVNADLFFFSCDGVSSTGVLSDNSKYNAHLRMRYMEHARTSVLLVDDTKLNKQYPYILCDLNRVDYCVCNTQVPATIAGTATHTVFK